MIPILFGPTATVFDTNGLGALADAVSCKVTEELNGAFELALTYPLTGKRFGDIQPRGIVLAKPSPYAAAQPFRIYDISKPMRGSITVYARHLSYDLSGIPVSPFTAGSLSAALNGLKSNTVTPCPFTFQTDKSVSAGFSVAVPAAIRSLLGGQSGSVLDVYGGEYEWDGYTVKLLTRRGQDNGVSIRYGKNLTDLTQEENIANVATGVYPFWQSLDGRVVEAPGKIVNAPGTYNFVRILPLDLTGEFETEPTPEQLQTRAQTYVERNGIGVPAVSISVAFQPLEQTEEYRHLALLEKVQLGDTVTVEYPALGVSATARVAAAVYDVLLDRYERVQLGSVRSRLSTTITEQQKEIEQRPTLSASQRLTNTILGALGGAVRLLDTNGDGWPDTLYIANDPDPAKATKVWRYNYEGWAASTNGYNGPFVLGATLDDGLLADFITAAHLAAGTIKSKDGETFFLDLDAGILRANFTELYIGSKSPLEEIENSENRVTVNYESRISQTAQDLRTEVSETYETKDGSEQKYTTLSQTVEGLAATASHRGGDNLLLGTAAYELTGWDASENAGCTRSSPLLLGNVQSGGAFVLPAGESLAQTVATRRGERYCWLARVYIDGAVSPSAVLTVAGEDIAITGGGEWLTLQGSFTAPGERCTVQVVNHAGTLYLADLTLMPGERVTDWQQAANEIYTDEMRFAGGVLSVGSSRDEQHAEMSGSHFSITSNSTGRHLAYFAGDTALFGRTVIRGSLTVQADETENCAMAFLPQGDGHGFIVIND